MALSPTLKGLECCLGKLTDRVTADEAALATEQAGERFGNVTLLGGSGTPVADTNITANSIIIVGRKTLGGTPGNLSYTLTPGVGFNIASSDATDVSVLSYHIKY